MTHEPDDLVQVAAQRISVSPVVSLVRVRLAGTLPELEPRLIVHASGGASTYAPLVPAAAAGSDGAVTFAFSVPATVVATADGWALELGPGSEIAIEPPVAVDPADREPTGSRRDEREQQDAAEARARTEARAREEAAARRRWQERALAVHAEKEAVVMRLEQLTVAPGSGAGTGTHVERLERELERVARDAQRATALAEELTEALDAANRRADLARLEAVALAARLDEASAGRRAAERRLAEALEAPDLDWDADLPDGSLSS